jgi:hypothetical protein
MGILAEPARFVEALKLPKGFSVCELGDQWVTHVAPHRLAEEWYRDLGCGRYVSLDANGRGSMTVDLNQKWKHDIGTFDLVTDFGTGEHIFNQAEVWRTMHLLTKVGGYIVFDRPSDGYPGHCFYLVQETLFRDLADANGYDLMRLEQATTKRGSLWRGVFRKLRPGKFLAPQQGRYLKSMRRALVPDEQATRRLSC